MNEVAPHTIQTEVIKTALRQNKDGTYLTLLIHPDDNTERLISAHVGQRYMAVFAQLDTNDSLVEDPKVEEKAKLVTSAVMLCKEPDFQAFVGYRLKIIIMDENQCKSAMCGILGIQSRSELKENAEAAAAFETMRGEFHDYKRLNP